jgi:hypothetical protein
MSQVQVLTQCVLHNCGRSAATTCSLCILFPSPPSHPSLTCLPSSFSFKWERIGEVVGAPSTGGSGGGKKVHAGQEWDFVFDVDVGEGMPPRKLAVNAGDNPYAAAERFLLDEGLPLTYRWGSPRAWMGRWKACVWRVGHFWVEAAK